MNKYGPRPTNPLLARLDHLGKQSHAYHASAGLERDLAKRTGGRRTSGSGNQKEKGDVRVKGIARLEHKGTKHKSFRVTIEMLDKIENAGAGCDEISAMIIDFLDERGNSLGREIACIPARDLLDLINDRSPEERGTTHRDHSKHPKPKRTKIRKRPNR